ncbi:uncharacterized protein [Antedon mediterranea]|uniref:uncharacterized protein n=1 Tax=Antedon mediterranea TaxID=105859 RepID=UPI003AF99A42
MFIYLKKMNYNRYFVLVITVSFCKGQQFNATLDTPTTTQDDRNTIVAWFEDLSTDRLVLLVAAAVIFVLLILVCVLFYICYSCCKKRYAYSPQRQESTIKPVMVDVESKKIRYGFAVSAARESISELSPTSQKCAPWSDITSHQLNKVNSKVTRKLEKTVFVVENSEDDYRPTSNENQNGFRPRTGSVTASVHSRESNILRKSRKKSLLGESSRYPGGPSSNDNPLCKDGHDIDLFY